MLYSEFATDPCRSLFKRITQTFTGGPRFGANAYVTVGEIADDFVAQTEVPMPVAFDKATLDTIGVVDYDDQLKGDVTTAHPHYDRDQQASYNYLLNFGGHVRLRRLRTAQRKQHAATARQAHREETVVHAQLRHQRQVRHPDGVQALSP